MNAPPAQEHILLDDEERKITYAEDPKIADAGTFTVMKEDHTIGNILRM
jgi:DNA-directed RNA polymerase II subunit RPB11